MKRSMLLLDYTMMAFAAILGGGSVLLFATGGGASVVTMQWPEPMLLLWDSILSFAFFVQHSGMVRRSFHARIAPIVPTRYHGAFYSIASGLVLALVALFWQRSGTTLYHLQGVAYWMVVACAVASLLLLLWSARALQLFDPLGLAPIRAHLRGKKPHELPFTVQGPYRWVRHPIYFSILILFWATPVLTADRLLFNLLWSGWMITGTVLEERDLVFYFGEAYREYQRNVPMLIPWHRPLFREK